MPDNAITVLAACYLILVNAAVFLMMRSDKDRAKRGRGRRIPERKLLGWSAAGGALGGWLALRLLRHKTKHAAFALGLPVMLLLHIGILYILFKSMN
ncbi:DUF1294 domain-containing protein [Paenibacillus oenotherae]|uniref:DUF1294 domain-containing protein n=1 Tax=Paenibacillus oenotherae TaxID=1435645 RepID=UPI0031B9D47E